MEGVALLQLEPGADIPAQLKPPLGVHGMEILIVELAHGRGDRNLFRNSEL
jgi:hypothetical protein